MKAAFRVDASLKIGAGHVMRCLTLADALTEKGVTCHFISRAHVGNLIQYIRCRGYQIHILPSIPHAADRNTNPHRSQSTLSDSPHISWLGSSQHEDAVECKAILDKLQPDWLIVDHYALDAAWEKALQAPHRKLMVIDDLADRPHICNLLLDQNLGRQAHDYVTLLPAYSQTLIGPQYTLLRPEFPKLRKYSLKRRDNPQLKQLLITMGGVDQPNATSKVLEALKRCPLPSDCEITAVMGAATPWLAQVREQAAQMSWPTQVLVNINDMAQRIADSDLAIGAAGGTSWERCCLGLPTLLVVLAENQWPGARALHAARAVMLLGEDSAISYRLPSAMNTLLQSDSVLVEMSNNSRLITDGLGARRVLNQMEQSFIYE